MTRILTAATAAMLIMGAVAPALALERVKAAPPAPALSVTSPTIQAGRPIPLTHSAYGDGVSPALSWSAAPRTRSYAILVEDPDAKSEAPFVHWLAWNIPAGVTGLAAGVRPSPRPTAPLGMVQGRNSMGSPGYFGPRPPEGDPPHHYHFRILALDALLTLPPSAGRDRFMAAAKRHVVAQGELVAVFRR